jgi:hypothetical protein
LVCSRDHLYGGHDDPRCRGTEEIASYRCVVGGGLHVSVWLVV